MALHNIRGKEGEQLAAGYLSAHGYTILHRNWRYSYYEMDLIAHKNGALHFIEVKTRHTDTFGYPEEAVDRKKFNSLKKCAEFYLNLYPWWKQVQFDILSITRYRNQPAAYFLIEDFYF